MNYLFINFYLNSKLKIFSIKFYIKYLILIISYNSFTTIIKNSNQKYYMFIAHFLTIKTAQDMTYYLSDWNPNKIGEPSEKEKFELALEDGIKKVNDEIRFKNNAKEEEKMTLQTKIDTYNGRNTYLDVVTNPNASDEMKSQAAGALKAYESADRDYDLALDAERKAFQEKAAGDYLSSKIAEGGNGINIPRIN